MYLRFEVLKGFLKFNHDSEKVIFLKITTLCLLPFGLRVVTYLGAVRGSLATSAKF